MGRDCGGFGHHLAYPTQLSNAPLIVRNFIRNDPELWRGKQALCVATMEAFSGDGVGCVARFLKKCGATILGGADGAKCGQRKKG
jgi:hypothetical protein